MAPTAAFYIAVFLPEYWTSPLPVVVLPEVLRGGRAGWSFQVSQDERTTCSQEDGGQQQVSSPEKVPQGRAEGRLWS